MDECGSVVSLVGVIAGVGVLIGSDSRKAPINSQCTSIANGFG